MPWKYDENPVLCVLVRDQRRHYSYLQQGKPTHMTPERVKELEEIGFAWDTNDATWFQNYFQLVKYSESKFLDSKYYFAWIVLCILLDMSHSFFF